MRSLTRVQLFLSTLIVGAGLTTNVFALPGALDTTFSVDGITQSGPGYARIFSGICGDPDRGYAQAIQKNDGKIVVVSSTADGHVSVQRFTTAGKGDLTFGTSGRVVTDVGENVTISAVAIQSDGKIVVAGNSTAYYNVVLVRYLATGARDTSFDGDGIVLRNTGALNLFNPIITSMTIQPNGRYLLAGGVFRYDSNSRPHRELALFRFNTNGTPDTTFDTDGIVVTDSPYGTVHESCNAFTSVHYKSSTNRIVATGVVGQIILFSLPYVVQYTQYGTLDTSFGGGDGMYSPSGSGVSYNNASMIDPDGKILLADDRNIYRINPDGLGLDTTFGSSGFVIADGIASKSIRREESGRYIVSGRWTASGSERNQIVQRYNNNGTFDTSFGFGGSVITDVGIPLDFSRITLQSDGKIVLGGVSDTRFTLFRYLAD